LIGSKEPEDAPLELRLITSGACAAIIFNPEHIILSGTRSNYCNIPQR